MDKEEGMCTITSELYDKGVIKKEEMWEMKRTLKRNKPSYRSPMWFLLSLRKAAYWWHLSKRGYIWRKIFLLGLIIKYSLKDE